VYLLLAAESLLISATDIQKWKLGIHLLLHHVLKAFSMHSLHLRHSDLNIVILMVTGQPKWAFLALKLAKNANFPHPQPLKALLHLSNEFSLSFDVL